MLMDADGCWRMGDGCWRMGDGCWDTTDLSCGETRGALWQHKMSVAARQDLCGGKTQGRGPAAAATKGGGASRRPPFVDSFMSCHKRDIVLPQQSSCLATRHILSCHNSDLVLPQQRVLGTRY